MLQAKARATTTRAALAGLIVPRSLPAPPRRWALRSSPQSLEAAAGGAGVVDSVPGIAVTEIVLDQSQVVAFVGEREAARVPQCVRMDIRKAGTPGRRSDQIIDGLTGEPPQGVGLGKHAEPDRTTSDSGPRNMPTQALDPIVTVVNPLPLPAPGEQEDTVDVATSELLRKETPRTAAWVSAAEAGLAEHEPMDAHRAARIAACCIALLVHQSSPTPRLLTSTKVNTLHTNANSTAVVPRESAQKRFISTASRCSRRLWSEKRAC